MVKFLVKPALQLLLLLLIFAQAKAQETLSIVPGQTFDAGSGKMSKLLVCDENNYYIVRLNDKGDFEINTGADASIEVFNKEMNHISTIPVRCPEGTKYKRFEPISFIRTNDGFLVLAKNYNTSQKLIKSFIFKISDDGLILLVKSIGEIEGIAVSDEKFHFFQLDKIIENDVIRFVYSQILPTDINVPERVSFIIYDENLTITGERLINFPDDILDYHLSQIVMSESGQAFFRIETSNPYQMDKTIHQLIIYDILNDKTQNLEFNPEGGEIAKATLKKADNNTVGFFGYFTQKHDDPAPKGVLYYLFEANTGKLLRHEIYELSPEIREMYDPKNLFSASDYDHLMPQEIFLTSDNQVLLLFEFYWKKLMIVQDREGKPWTTPYFYANEIIILTFDQTDEFVNAGILPKEQLQANAYDLIGFSAFMAKNELIIIFNDNPKNAAEYRIEKLKTMKSSYSPMIAKYNFQKAAYAKEVFKTKNAGISFEPSAIYKISDHSVIFLNQSRPFNLIEIRF
jgi:hypothetical protein